MAANAVRAAEAILDGLPIRAVDTTVEKLSFFTPSRHLDFSRNTPPTGGISLVVLPEGGVMEPPFAPDSQEDRIATAQELLGLAEQYLEHGDSSRAAITVSIAEKIIAALTKRPK